MRKRAIGVAGSVIVHALVLAYVASFVRPRAPHRPARLAPPPEVEPLVVALFDDTPISTAPAAIPRPPTVAAPAAMPRSSHPLPVTAPAIGQTSALAPALVAPAPASPAPDPAPVAPAHLTVSADVLATIAAAPHAPAPETHAAPDRVRPAGTPYQPTFHITVAPDGTVKLTNKPTAHLVLPLQQAVETYLHTDHTLGGPAGDPAIATKYEPAPGTAINLGTSSSVNALPSSVGLSHNLDRKGTTITLPLIGGQFDATDALARRHGFDPHFARNLAVLDASRDERVALGTLNRAEQLASTPDLMQRNLTALWTDATLDLAAKKRALFELWDECAETGDPALVATATAARRQVLDFIRSHLPPTSPTAYTPADLADLARHQQSKAIFQPYAN